ncbi:neuralized-like protein 4 [Oscarella lobularis]|uniref:neuralized-like protein 4 n=1 Tax=Oscarella lobularis TaxID=121494 RepID=UPI003313AA7B
MSSGPKGIRIPNVGTKTLRFGYHQSNNSSMHVADDGRSAHKVNPQSTYGYGIVLANRPVVGETVFTVAIDQHGNSWSGSFKIGLMAVRKGTRLDELQVARYSPDFSRSWVWSATTLYLFVDSDSPRPRGNCNDQFFDVNLEGLQAGDTFGLHVTPEKRGTLAFYTNGEKAGEVTGVYDKCPDDMLLYPMVDHYAKGVSTTVIQAETHITRSLQGLCRSVILDSVANVECIHDLPLPLTLKRYIHVDEESARK